MKTYNTTIPYSALDLATIAQGQTAADAFRNSMNLARNAEQFGYTRYWFAEHHNMPGVASSATSILIGHIAGGTSTIRVGSGGIMLPNHAPLLIAEQFGTLASLYPGRIDLGLGRAPGTDQLTAKAIRGHNFEAEHNFIADLEMLQYLFFSRQQHSQSTCHTGRRSRHTYVDTGIKYRQRHCRGIYGVALCVCQPFCPGTVSYCHKTLPSAVCTIGTPAAAICACLC